MAFELVLVWYLAKCNEWPSNTTVSKMEVMTFNTFGVALSDV